MRVSGYFMNLCYTLFEKANNEEKNVAKKLSLGFFAVDHKRIMAMKW